MKYGFFQEYWDRDGECATCFELAKMLGTFNGAAMEYSFSLECVSREQAAVILSQFCAKAGIRLTTQFIDLRPVFDDYHQIDEQCLGALQTVFKLGLMRGVTDTLFMPKTPLTRIQALTALNRIKEITENFPEDVAVITEASKNTT